MLYSHSQFLACINTPFYLMFWYVYQFCIHIEKVNSSFESSYEDGLLDGRKELAENLLEQIKKWEEE